MAGTTCDLTGALYHSFAFHMWPMMLLFSLFGGVSWGILGFVLKRLRENRLRLDTLHQEFEFQVATLRHHYKNLAIGIHGFSGRIKRKITNLDETFASASPRALSTYEELQPEFESLANNFTVVEDAAQLDPAGRSTIPQAITSDTLALAQDLPRSYPLHRRLERTSVQA
jgi:hypothetical protein